MARLDGAITNIVDVFMDYADDGGKKRQLNKEELKKLFEQEIECPELKVNNSTRPSCMSKWIHLNYINVFSRTK